MSEATLLDRSPPSAAPQQMQVDRDALLAGLRAVGAVIERSNTIPILAHYRLRVVDSLLTITGTDLDTWSEVRMAAHGDLDTTVRSDKLVSAIDTLRPGAVAFSCVHGMMEIRQGRSIRKLATLPSVDFPVQKRAERPTQFEVPARAFAQMLDTTRVAMETNEVKYWLCGVLLHVMDGCLAAAATDGYKIVQGKMDLPSGAGGLAQTIISAKGVGLICRMLADAKDDDIARVHVSDRAVEVIHDRSTVAAKVVDGTFPNYTRALPLENPNQLTVHAAELDRCVRAAGQASDGKTRSVRLALSRQQCEVSGQASDGGRAVEPMDASYDGDDLILGLNFAYVSSILKALGLTADLTVAFRGAGDVVAITSSARPGILAGVMPMRA